MYGVLRFIFQVSIFSCNIYDTIEKLLLANTNTFLLIVHKKKKLANIHSISYTLELVTH